MGAAQVHGSTASARCEEYIEAARRWSEQQGVNFATVLEVLDRLCRCEDFRAKLRSQDPSARIVDEMIDTLFRVQDLNENGLLEEDELIQLNKKVAMLHYGPAVDKEALRAKYQELFRNELNPDGEDAVTPEKFREYVHGVLDATDKDPAAQQMILEQWITEAALGRTSFADPSMHSLSDIPFLLLKSFEADPISASVLSSSRGDSPPSSVPSPSPSDLSGALAADSEPSEDQAGAGGAPALPSFCKSAGRFGDDPVPRAPPPSEANNSGRSSFSVLGPAGVLESVGEVVAMGGLPAVTLLASMAAPPPAAVTVACN